MKSLNKKTAVIKPPEKKNVKLEQRFIFIDTSDVSEIINGTTFTVDFGETLKNVVEIELMSCQMPKNGGTAANGEINYGQNYILLFLDNLDLDNYKISTSNAVSHCFARLPVTGTTINVFFGRIKNFTNTYKFKPTLQSLNKLTVRITDKQGGAIGNLFGGSGSKGVQLTFAVTYQTQPHLFEN